MLAVLLVKKKNENCARFDELCPQILLAQSIKANYDWLIPVMSRNYLIHCVTLFEFQTIACV